MEEEPQALPPTPPELARVFSLVQAATKRGGRLLAFYNGGPGAGASQTWRHVQFVEGESPVEAWVRNVTFERKGESGEVERRAGRGARRGVERCDVHELRGAGLACRSRDTAASGIPLPRPVSCS